MPKIKPTYEDLVVCWLNDMTAAVREMSCAEGDLYSYDQLIGRVFSFHGKPQVFLLKTWPTKTTQKHLAAARRVIKQEDDVNAFYVDDVEAAHDRWIEAMFQWVEDTVERRTQFIINNDIMIERFSGEEEKIENGE